jgi:hypothetical protein
MPTEKRITATEARNLAAACREWPRGRDYVTRTLKGEPLHLLSEVTNRNAKFGYPPVQLARWRKGLRRIFDISRRVDDTYYEETGRDFDNDIITRPLTVAKFFESYAKRLEKNA